ncbi:MAG: lytic transglycosylase domain-containing protein [Capsulimonadales bacterium]|nr:lytic transglycosylase domain-containing protein [Capsulimonadales bacterium]
MRFCSLFVGVIALVYLTLRPLAASAQTTDDSRSPSEQYLSLRRLYPPTRGLTPVLVGADPGRYRGATMELEGTLSGIVEQSEGGCLLMLTSPRDGHLNLTMTQMPSWVQPGTRLRLLVVVTSPADGTVLAGIPDFQVVSVASASDISAAELAWQAEAAERARRARQREAGLRAAQEELSGSNRAGNAPRVGTGRMADSRRVAGYNLSEKAQAIYPAYLDFVRRYNRRLAPAQAEAIAASILLYSEAYDLDPRLMVALIIAESDFRPGETSHKGAMGLGQLMKDEVRRLRLSNPYDPVQNIAGVSFLLKERLNKYSGSGSFKDASMRHIVLALASYNAGMGAVRKYGGVPPYRETQNYVKKIERIYRQLCRDDAAGNARAADNGGEDKI